MEFKEWFYFPQWCYVYILIAPGQYFITENKKILIDYLAKIHKAIKTTAYNSNNAMKNHKYCYNIKTIFKTNVKEKFW